MTAIDWSYGSVAPLGSDLGQLVSGRAGDRDRSAEEWTSLVADVRDAFVEGLADEGLDVDPTVVERALLTDMATRFAFSALLVEPDDDHGRTSCLVARRAVLARVTMDLALGAMPTA